MSKAAATARLKQVSAILARPYEWVFVPEIDPEFPYVGSGGWSCSIRELPGCIAQGDSFAKAYEALERAARSWIEAALDDPSYSIPEPLSSRVSKTSKET